MYFKISYYLVLKKLYIDNLVGIYIIYYFGYYTSVLIFKTIIIVALSLYTYVHNWLLVFTVLIRYLVNIKNNLLTLFYYDFIESDNFC